MKRIKHIVPLFLLAITPIIGTAQTAKSSYFLDGSFYGYQINPAMKAERGFFSLLGGNFSLGTNSNVGLSTFLYPIGNDKLTTFMSGQVPANEFLSKIPKEGARMGFNLDETILAMGMRMFGGYTTFSVSLHSDIAMALPKGFFEFAKMGLAQNNYTFSGINMSTLNYAAATLGYSREIFEGFRLGANVKYLLGLAHADVTVDKLNVELSEERWMIESHAQARMALFSEPRLNVNDEGVIEGFELGSLTPSAKGIAFDLGVMYDMKNIVPGLTLSASLVDIGKINWQNMVKAESTEAKVEFNGFESIDPNDMNASVNDELERLSEDASKMLEFQVDEVEPMTTNLNATMYLGAEYTFCRPLSVGVLYAQRFTKSQFNKWHELRGFLNLAPFKWLEASVNYGTTSYGTSLGWIFNFHPGGITFFVGSDYMVTKVTPQFIPVDNLNSHITLGFNLAMGKRK